MSQDNFERFSKLIIDKLGVEPGQVTRDASFVDDLGADSLDMVELMMDVEEEFGIPQIPDEELATRVGDCLLNRNAIGLQNDDARAADRRAT